MWKINNKKFKKPDNYYGFLYKITDDTGKVYFGKKAFEHKRKVRLSKKARKSTGKRISIQKKDSGWEDYWGSCKPLLEYIKNKGNTSGFKREILKLCTDRQSLNYWEQELLIREKVLFRDDCWNSNIAGRFFKGKIHE